jgi:excisionase family DNA binding protein
MTEAQPRWITAKEAAEILECNPRSIHHLIATGRLEARQAVVHQRINRDSVMRLAKQIQSSTPKGK